MYERENTMQIKLLITKKNCPLVRAVLNIRVFQNPEITLQPLSRQVFAACNTTDGKFIKAD